MGINAALRRDCLRIASRSGHRAYARLQERCQTLFPQYMHIHCE
jgi:hypothetical protein